MNKKSLDKYEIITWIYIFIFSIIIIYIIIKIFWFYDNYKIYLDNLYNYDFFIILINSNIKYFLWIILIYLIFLWYIKEKKWIIFWTIWEWTINSKYWNIFLLLNKSISFLSIFYLYFLYETVHFFELIIILWLSILIFFTLYLIKKYLDIRQNYDLLENIIKVDLNSKNKNLEYLILKIFTSTYNEYLIWITFTLAFIIIPLWMKLNFNLITIIILHINFIFIFIALNLLSHKFPSKVKVKFNNQIKEWFLLENTKDRIILMTKKENYILNTDKIEYIKIEPK